MSALRRLLFALAFVAMGLGAPRAEAFPSQRVHDRLWAKSQPWMTITLPGGSGSQWIWIHATNVNATCDDPVPGRNEPLCTTPDHGFNVHVFVDGGGEVQGPQQCLDADCWRFWWIPPGVTRVGLLVHGTHDTRGIVSGGLDLYANSNWQSASPLSFSGDVVLDVTAPSHNFDIETVLLPDGPILDPGGGPARPGNSANDFLGTDATEVWMLAADGMMVSADTGLTGVGFAGRLGWGSFNWLPYHTVVIRPWARPPSGFVVVVHGATQWWPSPPSAPTTVGTGRMRAILNDHVGYDLDGDGLSSAVEAEIGTCNGASRWAGVIACIHADTFLAHPDDAFMDPRDTDGDGISDFAEVIGSDISIGSQPRADGSCDGPATLPSMEFGANQTLPLWGFNPLHKDALIEIDMGPRNNDRACPAVGAPDTTCNTWMGQRYAVPPMGATTLSSYLTAFQQWHQLYAQLEASRVNNPDNKPGIELHFDVTTSPVVSTHHGERSEFNIADYTGQVRPGLLTFDSARQSGSACSCKNQQNCVSPLHGGFGRWTRHNDAGGGGQSGFAGPVDGAILSGSTPAHELGHHLGLAHGGPYRYLGNPFISNEAWDVDVNFKVPHVSIMNYGYGYNPGMTFSRGAYRPYPLPRLATDGSGLFGYQETLPTEGAVTTTPFFGHGGVGAGFTPGPAACSGASCVHSDFDRSGTFGGVLTTGFSGTDVVLGAHNWVFQEGYYCDGEGVRANQTDGNGRCCRAGVRNTAGVCPSGSPPDAQPDTRTMMLAGQSATIAANGRLYSFFLDDVAPDAIFAWPNAPEARRTCSTRGVSAVGSCTTQITARLRWAAIDGFSVPSTVAEPLQCATGDCVTPVANQLGNLKVDGTTNPLPGAVSRFTGSTQLAAATLGSGANQKVILAWATRRGTVNGGLRCATTLPWCADEWSPLEVRYGNASTLETNGVQVQGSTGAALFTNITASDGAARGDHVSGVALAAWDPDDNGAPTRAMLVARVVGAPGRDDGELYWTMCDMAGCGQMQRLTSYTGGMAGPVVRSFTTIAAAVDHPSGGAPSLALVWGAAAVAPDLADLRVLRMTPGPGMGAPFERRALDVLRTGGGAPRQSLIESSVGVAFTAAAHGNRMILTAEGPAGDDPVMFYWTATRAFEPVTDTAFVLATEVRNIWDYSRATVGNDVAMNGEILPRRAHAPGFVASLYQDDRPNVTGGDGRISFLEGNVRAGVQHLGAFGPLFLLRPMVDSRLFAEHRDYEEVNTLGYFLCPTLARASRGTLGPDLLYRGSPLGELRCQRGAAWGRNSGGLANLSNPMGPCCSGPCPRSWNLPDCYLSRVADYVTQPGMLAPPTAIPPAEDTGLDVSPHSTQTCRSGSGQAAALASPVLQ